MIITLGNIIGDIIGGIVEEVFQQAFNDYRESRKYKKAGKIIKNGGLVVFPTETVYGIGADAFNANAIAQIYYVKGRPSDNPLILHIADKEKFYELIEFPPNYAKKLIETYWPGPLTLVGKKKPGLPHWLGSHPLENDSTETVGIRMPQNPIALEIIRHSKTVVAAPSANRAGKPSPTNSAHIDFGEEQNREIGMIVSGGATKVGLESTVVDITGDIPVILRPGAITTEMIYTTTGINPISQSIPTVHPRSPGMKYRHYAPDAPMTIFSGDREIVVDHMLIETSKKINEGKKVGLLVTNSTREYIKESRLFADYTGNNLKIVTFGDEPEIIAKNLYASLRRFDKLEVSEIYAEAVPNVGIGEAIMNRMFKAAEGRVIVVDNQT